MGCETFTTEIEGSKYSYTQLTAKKSLRLKYELLGIMGGAFSDIASAMDIEDTTSDAEEFAKREKQIKVFGSAIEHIFSGSNPDKMVDMIETILIPAFKDGERIDLDTHFTGKTKQMYSVVFWILTCEYGDFLEGLDNL